MAKHSEPCDIFEQVREARRRIAEECGDDPWKYAEYLKDLENSPELRDRIYTPPERNWNKPAA